MTTITANDIKRRGVVSIAEMLENSKEAIISVRGKNKYTGNGVKSLFLTIII